MKEATGELNITVITVIIIAALAAIGTTVIFPMITGGLRNQTCEATLGEGSKAMKDNTNVWYCCPAGTSGINTATCQIME